MEYVFGLCRGRHEIPSVEVYLFPHEVDPTNVDALRKRAWEGIPKDASKVTVYVTGLTVAMMAVVQVCFARQIALTAMHYNRETEDFYPQEILEYQMCGFCHKPMSLYDLACPHCGAT